MAYHNGARITCANWTCRFNVIDGKGLWISSWESPHNVEINMLRWIVLDNLIVIIFPSRHSKLRAHVASSMALSRTSWSWTWSGPEEWSESVTLPWHISKTPWYFLVLVAYLIILGVIQADSRESPRTVQVNYTLLGHYLWEFLVQARSANFLLTFQPFSGLISGQYPKKEIQVSSK